jgi:carboxylesterase
MRGAEPFLLPGGNAGVLLIHGFTGSPSEMRLAGEYLNSEGFTVLAPRLYGHGSTIDELSKTNWKYWYASAEDGYHMLKGMCGEIVVAGLSMGALLGLKLCTEYPITKVVSLSAPIYIADKRIYMLPLAKMFREYVPKRHWQMRRQSLSEDEKYLIGYDQTPLKSLSSLLELISQTKDLLPEIKTPVLLIQSENEHTVEPRSAQYIYDNLGSMDKQIVWLKKAGHVVTLGIERQLVFETMGKFFKNNSQEV